MNKPDPFKNKKPVAVSEDDDRGNNWDLEPDYDCRDEHDPTL